MMSFFGNILGVTTQAAFVQSMIVVFAGGKTGLSAVVTGALILLPFRRSTVVQRLGSNSLVTNSVNGPDGGRFTVNYILLCAGPHLLNNAAERHRLEYFI